MFIQRFFKILEIHFCKTLAKLTGSAVRINSKKPKVKKKSRSSHAGIWTCNPTSSSEKSVASCHSAMPPVPEMPTSGRPKIGRLSIFHYPPEFQRPHPPPRPVPPKNWPSPNWEWPRTLYDVLHNVHTIKIRNHRFDARSKLCQWLNTFKNAPETVLRIRKIQVLS